MTVSAYFKQKVNYGGEWVTIGHIYRELGPKAACIWLVGYARGGGEVK